MDSSTLASLPFELLENIAINLSYSDLMRLCSTSPRLSALCQSEGFWRRKYQHDFHQTVPPDDDPREAYEKKLFTTVIHLVYQNFNVYLLYNSSSGFITKSRPTKLIHPRAHQIEWHPTTRRTTPLVLAAGTRYQKNLGPGRVIGIVALELEKIYSTIYKDPFTRTGLALDNELYYPDNPQIERSIRISREAGAAVLEVRNNQILCLDPLPYPQNPRNSQNPWP